MQTPDSIRIVERYFLALDTLKNEKVIRGIQTFTRKYGINRRNMLTLRKEPERDIFQVAWLAYLVNDFGVSSDWLLTGAGTFYRKKPLENRNGEKEPTLSIGATD